MTIVVFFEGETPHTEKRWPCLLRAMEGVTWYKRHNDKQGNADALGALAVEFPNHTPVYIVAGDRCPERVRLLDEFQHPEKAIYVFGPDYGQLIPPKGAVCVTIFMSLSRRSLFADHAGAIVLYHRRTQRGVWT